jgi:hypothetical protein
MKEELVDVRSVLPDLLADLPGNAQADVEEAILAECVRAAGEFSDDRMVERRLSGDGYIAIRWSDVDLLKVIIPATIGLAGPMPPVAAALLVLLWEYRRKQVHLTNDEGVVLLTVRKAPTDGWDVGAICQDLPLQVNPDPQEIGRVLERLLLTVDQSGRTVPLVEKRGDKWRVLDV